MAPRKVFPYHILYVCVLPFIQGCVQIPGNRTDSFYLISAQPVAPDYLFSLDTDPERNDLFRNSFGFFAHRVRKGSGLIIAFRRFSNPTIAFDDESYEKLTIWSKSGEIPSSTQIDLANNVNFLVTYSSGSSAWPVFDCSGYVTSGSLLVEPDGKSYRVQLQGQLEPHGYSSLAKTCVPIPVSLAFKAQSLVFDNLTPWLGQEGEHPYDETYR